MKKQRSAVERSNRVSVIIPNLNGEKWLGACLKSLSMQTRKPMEVILVDNGSTDSSLEVVRNCAPDTKIIRLQLL